MIGFTDRKAHAKPTIAAPAGSCILEHTITGAVGQPGFLLLSDDAHSVDIEAVMSAMFSRSRCRIALTAGALVWFLALAVCAEAGQQPAAAPVGTVGAVAGVLMERTAPGADWRFVDENNAITPDALLVALPDATLYSANKNVMLKMVADIGHRGPLPVFESAIRIHADPQVDLDVTVERGIVGFANLSKGPARVRVRLADQTWMLTLRDPGTKVGLEIHGRHPPGIPHFVETNAHVKLTEPPTMAVFLLVVQGHVGLEADGREITLEAPPGAAKAHWDNVLKKIEVMHLDKLPETLEPRTAEEKEKYKEICDAVRMLRSGPIDTVLEKALNSDNPVVHRGAVVVLAALDKVPRLVDVLGSSQFQDAREKAIVVLRNWLGRGPGQAEKLYDFFITERKLTPAQAKTGIHLLFGFDEEEQRDPDTYEVLIQCLKHSKLGVRELAHWHLERLAPEVSKEVPYDAAAPADQRERAYERWQARIPAGQLPPHLRQPPADKK